MIKYKTITKTTKTIADILCNQCGKSMQMEHHGGQLRDGKEYLGLLNTVVDGCYGSDYLLDTHRYNFSMCEECLVNLFNGFKIPPTVHEYGIVDDLTLDSLSWQEDRTLFDRMEDQRNAIEVWSCKCKPHQTHIWIGKKYVHWHRNLLRPIHQENDLYKIRIDCLDIESVAKSEDEVYELFDSSMKSMLIDLYKSENVHLLFKPEEHWVRQDD